MAENTQLDALEYGNVNISDDVIGVITSLAASEIKGVNELSGTLSEEIVGMFGRKNLQKGVKVELVDEQVLIDLNVIVDFGTKIPEVSWKIQESVKSAVENMTGLKVREVNIHVQGINTSKNKDVIDD